MGAVPSWMWSTADEVVNEAWKAANAGKAISVPGKAYKVISMISRFGPRPFVRKMGMNVRVRQRQK